MKRRMFWFVTIVLTIWLSGMTVLLADAQTSANDNASIIISDYQCQVVLNKVTPKKAIRLFVDETVQAGQNSFIPDANDPEADWAPYCVIYDNKTYTVWHEWRGGDSLIIETTRVSDARKALYKYIASYYESTGEMW